ncbi:MAG: hypothetical protein QGH45_16915, partial [Myxococcota bacterium]|nr:hypothetical protein [Myxococcota bacterium]
MIRVTDPGVEGRPDQAELQREVGVTELLDPPPRPAKGRLGKQPREPLRHPALDVGRTRARPEERDVQLDHRSPLGGQHRP